MKEFSPTLRHSRIISGNGYRRFPKTVKDFRRLTKRSDHYRRCPKNPPNTFKIVFSSETVNIEKLANLIANSKNYGQITLNTKPHSDPTSSPGLFHPFFKGKALGTRLILTLMIKLRKLLKKCLKSVLYSTKAFSCLPVDCKVKAVGFFSKSV